MLCGIGRVVYLFDIYPIYRRYRYIVSIGFVFWAYVLASAFIGYKRDLSIIFIGCAFQRYTLVTAGLDHLFMQGGNSRCIYCLCLSCSLCHARLVLSVTTRYFSSTVDIFSPIFDRCDTLRQYQHIARYDLPIYIIDRSFSPIDDLKDWLASATLRVGVFFFFSDVFFFLIRFFFCPYYWKIIHCFGELGVGGRGWKIW